MFLPASLKIGLLTGFILLLTGLTATGLSAEEILLGMSAAFKGPSRGLSIELYRGSLAYFQHVNKEGGVHGRSLRLKVYDDGYNPKETLANTIRLLGQDKVFLLFEYMGTPTVTRILPLLKKYEEESVYLFCPFSGAELPRRSPYNQFVFNLRASYQQETAHLIDHFIRIGRKRIAVFYQIDAYGRSGWEGVRLNLARHGLEIVAEATYQRGTPYPTSMERQVAILRKANPDAIISTATYTAAAAFIRDVRAAGWADVPIANISGVDSDNMLRLLLEQGQATGKDYTVNLINSQVVPSYEDTKLPAVQEYRRLMDLYKPLPPAELLDEQYQAPAYSFNSLEGYLNAKLLVEILKKLGPGLQRELIKETVEGTKNLDLGIDQPVVFGPQRHQGLDRVYCTMIRGDRFVTLADEDWQKWHR